MHNINFQSSFLIEVPGADLADRYGIDNKFEFKLEYLYKSNWAAYLKGGLRINQKVKEDVLAPIRTNEGFVIGVNGFYADIYGRKRGYDLGIGMDKLIPYKGQNLRFGIGTSYITHWVKIIDDSQSVPQVTNDSGQFFDRFVSGFGIEENFQYQYNLDGNRSAFLFGFQLGQFFTKEHRYKLIQPETKQRRLDLYFGLKLSYLLPIYSFEKGENTYY